MNIYGQRWAVDGAVWYYGYKPGMSPGETYIRAEVTGDTIFENRLCKKITWAFHNSTVLKTMITYEDNDIVYWYNQHIDTFTILYDFNTLPGNTWQIQLYDSCFSIVRVDSISQLVINGDTLKVLHVTDSILSIGNTIIESIGSTHFLFPDERANCHNIVFDSNEPLGLRCYEDTIIGFYETHIAPSCTYTFIFIGIIEAGKEHFNIFPNPTSGDIRFVFPTNLERIEIFDLSGQLVKVSYDMQSANLYGLTSGTYVLKLTDKSGNLGIRRIVKLPSIGRQ